MTPEELQNTTRAEAGVLLYFTKEKCNVSIYRVQA